MFAGKAAAYPSEAHLRWSTLGQAPGLTYKTRQEGLATDKHSSLLSKGVTYGRKKSMCFKTFNGSNSCCNLVSQIVCLSLSPTLLFVVQGWSLP